MRLIYELAAGVRPPSRAHADDAALNLYTPRGGEYTITPGKVTTIDLGIRLAIPDGYYGQLTLRSSLGLEGLCIPQGVGIIDAGYRGNVKLNVTALAGEKKLQGGGAPCQLIILPVPRVDLAAEPVVADTPRGLGGFGSTGQTPKNTAATISVRHAIAQLSQIADRYGADTPLVVDGMNGRYEQAALISVRRLQAGPVVCGWAQYESSDQGAPAAVIS